MSSRRSFTTRLALLAAVTCSAAVAQDAPAIDTFSVESQLTIDKIGVASPTINIPTNVLASIAAGALEIRQLVTYVPSTRVLRVRHLLVQAKAPNPTPAGTQVATIEDYNVAVRDVLRGTTPPTITFIGTVNAYSTDSPFGIQPGMPFIYSIGYDTSTPPKFNTIQLLVPGRASGYAATGSGTLTFVSTTTPGTGDLKASAGSDFTTSVSEIALDASGSTAGASGGTLTYRWRVVTGAANILDVTAVKPRVQLAENFATYTFEVTVTDASGKTAVATVKVTYSGRF